MFPHLVPLLCSIKETSIQALIRCLFWHTSLLCSWSASFPNKVIILCLSICSPYLLVYHVASRASLDSGTKLYKIILKIFKDQLMTSASLPPSSINFLLFPCSTLKLTATHPDVEVSWLSPSPSCFQGQSPILEILLLQIFPFNLSLLLPLVDFLLIFHWDHSNCNLIHFPLQLIHFELTSLFLIILLLHLKQFKYLTYKFTSYFTMLFIFASVSLFSSLFPKITLK